MLGELFGSETSEKVLIYLIAQGEGYSKEIADAFRISNTQVLRTLTKLEEADVLVGVSVGRTRIYRLNPRWVLASELRNLLEKALKQIPLEQQEKIFMKRKAPRKKNKSL